MTESDISPLVEKAEARINNREIITRAIQDLLEMDISIGGEQRVPLNNLQLPQEISQGDFFATLVATRIEEVGSRAEANLQIKVIRRENGKDQDLAQRTIDFVDNPNTRVLAQRLHGKRVVMISSSINILDHRAEGCGIGSALMAENDSLVQVGIKTFSLENHEVIFAYIEDAATGASSKRNNAGDQYRKGWSSYQAQELGFQRVTSSNYLSQKLLDLRASIFVKVYKDNTL